MQGHAPYKGVLTHGFTVDEKGRKMSKSLGNVVLPQKVMSTLGADILRLWVAATDYANEMSVSDEILKRMADSYRRIRNTARFLLGNLAGFDPARRRGAGRRRWSSSTAGRSTRTRVLQEEMLAAYRSYDFHLIYQKIHNFCVVDLGGFYLDVIKDRLYTTPARRPAAALRADRHVLRSPRRWCAGWRRSCRSPPRRSGGTCRASAPSRCSSRPGPQSPPFPRGSLAVDWTRRARGAQRRAARTGAPARRGRDRRAARRDVEIYADRRPSRRSSRSAMSCASR